MTPTRAWSVAAGLLFAAGASAALQPVGLGSHWVGAVEGTQGPPPPRAGTPAAPVPTNDWWSSLVFPGRPLPLFAHPLAFEFRPEGLRIVHAGARLVAHPNDIVGGLGGPQDDVVVGLAGEEPLGDPVVVSSSDWWVEAEAAAGPAGLRVSIGHGSPLAFLRARGAPLRFRFARAPEVQREDDDGRSVLIRTPGGWYGLFLAPGGRWRERREADWVAATGPEGEATVALLPDGAAATWRLFRARAHARVVDSQVRWAVDPVTGDVTTTFRVVTAPAAGTAPEPGTLMALYPHQWRAWAGPGPAPSAEKAYDSVRGPLRLIEGESFQTRHPCPGVLPMVPPARTRNPAAVARGLSALVAEAGRRPADTYWGGKELARLVVLGQAAESEGQGAVASQARTRLRALLENWFQADDLARPPGSEQRAGFTYRPDWGTLIGYPASYGSDTDLNDHHFHYGYFLRAAAEMARLEPAWSAPTAWGAMVDELARNIAGPKGDPRYPAWRNFDPYAGHSWASGAARFADGNNQESSSEAMAAWTGLILWGELSGRPEWTSVGRYLYATELAAVESYWFDRYGDQGRSGYAHPGAAIIWGGKTTWATWFSGEPEHIHGINWLPFHGGSFYLGRDPALAGRHYEALRATRGGEGWKSWAEIILMYRALSDPADALRQWQAGAATLPRDPGLPEVQLLGWAQLLADHGLVAGDVTADAPLHLVLRRDGITTRFAFNAGEQDRRVRFSDGASFMVPARSLARQVGDAAAEVVVRPPTVDWTAKPAEERLPASPPEPSAPSASSAALTPEPTPAPPAVPPVEGEVYHFDAGGAGQEVAQAPGLTVLGWTVASGIAVPGTAVTEFGPGRRWRLEAIGAGGWNAGEAEHGAMDGSYLYAGGSGSVAPSVRLRLSGFDPADRVRVEIRRGRVDGRDPTVAFTLADGTVQARTARDPGRWVAIAVLHGARAYDGELRHEAGGEANLAGLRVTVGR